MYSMSLNSSKQKELTANLHLIQNLQLIGNTETKKPKRLAQWILCDGKLVCRWDINA